MSTRSRPARGPAEMAVLTRRWWGMTPAGWAALAGLQLLPLLVAKHAPIQDYPGHLARQLVLRDLALDHGAKFGAAFTWHGGFAAYAGFDWLCLAAQAALPRLGIGTLGAAVLALYLLGFPLALGLAARAF